MTPANIDSIIQGATLVVLAATVLYSARQAKASESMARLSLQQTELMRPQMHAAFRPFVEVSSGVYGPNSANFIFQNLGTGPALNLFAVYRGGYKHALGSLAPEQTVPFRFDNGMNVVPQPVGFASSQPTEPTQSVPLRLEYRSVTGARYWTNINFPLGREGALEPEIEHGMEMPQPLV